MDGNEGATSKWDGGGDSWSDWKGFSRIGTSTTSPVLDSISAGNQEIQVAQRVFHTNTKTRTKEIRLQALLNLSLDFGFGGMMRSTRAPGGDEGCDGDGGDGRKKADGIEYERLGRCERGPSGMEGGGDLSDHDFARCSELESELRRLWNGGYSLAGVDGGVRGRLQNRTRSNLRETYASEFIRRTVGGRQRTRHDLLVATAHHYYYY